VRLAGKSECASGLFCYSDDGVHGTCEEYF
jgi:hypothetical protein